ncbi:hypothetical protein OUZ56_019211 [Daphnia magna]|uniref:Uncharacterized protein n=1 Tax=Daphnia magna TaxID=35525 RepID=A0ABQ9ZAY5_9CRUS|nr:hypothetical protein OUZ56_019211 [Daphnia magna]
MYTTCFHPALWLVDFFLAMAVLFLWPFPIPRTAHGVRFIISNTFGRPASLFSLPRKEDGDDEMPQIEEEEEKNSDVMPKSPAVSPQPFDQSLKYRQLIPPLLSPLLIIHWHFLQTSTPPTTVFFVLSFRDFYCSTSDDVVVLFPVAL